MMRLEHPPRALLIQNISELQAMLKKPIETILESYVFDGASEETVYCWLISEFLYRHHNLFERYHEHYHRTVQFIYDEMEQMLPYPIRILFDACIKAPTLYRGCRDVVIDIKGHDLYIWYFS